MRPFNLQKQLPPGWTLRQLSVEKFDGVNFYRATLGNPELLFQMPARGIFALAYQPYSSHSDIRAHVRLDDAAMPTSLHPLGTYTTGSVVVTLALAPGPHRLRWHLSCDRQPCVADNVRLYQLNHQPLYV